MTFTCFCNIFDKLTVISNVSVEMTVKSQRYLADDDYKIVIGSLIFVVFPSCSL